MRIIILLFILMFGCKQEDGRSVELEAIVKNAQCSNSLFETHCESNVMFIEEPIVGSRCNTKGLAGVVGDTVLIKLVVVDSTTVKCVLPWR